MDLGWKSKMNKVFDPLGPIVGRPIRFAGAMVIFVRFLVRFLHFCARGLERRLISLRRLDAANQIVIAKETVRDQHSLLPLLRRLAHLSAVTPFILGEARQPSHPLWSARFLIYAISNYHPPLAPQLAED